LETSTASSGPLGQGGETGTSGATKAGEDLTEVDPFAAQEGIAESLFLPPISVPFASGSFERPTVGITFTDASCKVLLKSVPNSTKQTQN
jgi:hypothetical protein